MQALMMHGPSLMPPCMVDQPPMSHKEYEDMAIEMALELQWAGSTALDIPLQPPMEEMEPWALIDSIPATRNGVYAVANNG